jgi:pimeloyl-ACP methyl ester carboxylesterase
VLVVHSQGGIGLEVAARAPELLSALVLVDCPFAPPPPVVAAFQGALAGLRSPAYREVIDGLADQVVFLPTDDADRRARLTAALKAQPQEVLAGTWEAFLEHDQAAAAAHCHVPLLHLGGVMPVDRDRLRALCPQVTFGMTVGAGHYLQLEVPEQVNAMLDRFLKVNRL